MFRHKKTIKEIFVRSTSLLTGIEGRAICTLDPNTDPIEKTYLARFELFTEVNGERKMIYSFLTTHGNHNCEHTFEQAILIREKTKLILIGQSDNPNLEGDIHIRRTDK